MRNLTFTDRETGKVATFKEIQKNLRKHFPWAILKPAQGLYRWELIIGHRLSKGQRFNSILIILSEREDQAYRFHRQYPCEGNRQEALKYTRLVHIAFYLDEKYTTEVTK